VAEILLLGGEEFGFTLACDVKGPACTAREVNRVGVITMAESFKQLNACRACYDEKRASGEWTLKKAKKRGAAEPGDVDGSSGDDPRFLPIFAEIRRAKKEGEFGSGALRLNVAGPAHALEVAFCGWMADGVLRALLELLASERVAAELATFRLTGEDEGTNGTREWNLEPLLAAARFPKLTVFDVERTKPDDNNRTIIAKDMEENGVIAALLDRMPALTDLRLPSAPSEAFFARAAHPLARLEVQSGFEPNDFLARLGASDAFTQLEALDFTDYAETYADDFEELRTPVGVLDAFFQTRALPKLTTLTLRGTRLAPDDERRLRETPLGRQLRALRIEPLEGA
jgi:hypothetical protein